MPRGRASGILLHPSSLPGSAGIGDLGPGAARFLEWLEGAGQSLWQVLALGPTGHGNSPYLAPSAFAGNPLLISPERLDEEGLLSPDTPPEPAWAEPGRVDYPRVAAWKEALLRASWERFRSGAGPPGLTRELERFAATEGPIWLADWGLFAALKSRFEGRPWLEWPAPYRRREGPVLARERQRLAAEIGFHEFVQFLFFRQWRALRERARARRIRVLGDLPIYVALDSADVWARPEQFELAPDGRPLAVAGVPPDAFSAEGQLWGNPLYRWDRMREDGYAWWTARLRAALRLADVIRLDHFRGFVAYWRVPAEAPSAAAGEWAPGPGRRFFRTVTAALGKAALVAEDLGHITPDVHQLRRELGIPGMRVLQFGFGEDGGGHLPHAYPPDAVAYTGTHDNDTCRGWLEALDHDVRKRALTYLGCSAEDIHWGMIRALATSVAQAAIVPLQDALGLGSEARMNRPGQARGNWEWRLREAPGPEPAARLRRLAELTGRLPDSRA